VRVVVVVTAFKKCLMQGNYRYIDQQSNLPFAADRFRTPGHDESGGPGKLRLSLANHSRKAATLWRVKWAGGHTK
jgi:hypothetical protein